ncbi:MAG: hypothetical protein ACD_73C00107G0001 [uncultured bacterium]|nr:MAG: hypothetical protein ACD_73C00107G0001 [uncultured bacterium]
MNNILNSLLAKFSKYGVLHRDVVRQDQTSLKRFLNLGFSQKIYQRGQVFYELTQKALPLLENYRKILLEEASLMALLCPWSKVYTALLDDVRFLDSENPKAQDFLFLGDWQLKRPVVASQLELSKYRYYEKRGLVEYDAA